DWQPGAHLALSANEDYWAGRPFLDAVDVRLGSVQRDRVCALGLDGSDVVEISIPQAKRLSQASQRVSFTPLTNLVALDFFRRDDSAGAKTADARLREAIS